jgi:hypothetical protein
MTELRGPEGSRGVDIERPNGSKIKLNADRGGKVSVNNRALVRKLKDEGFTTAGLVTGFARGYPCSCGFASVFKICGKCGQNNG